MAYSACALYCIICNVHCIVHVVHQNVHMGQHGWPEPTFIRGTADKWPATRSEPDLSWVSQNCHAMLDLGVKSEKSQDWKSSDHCNMSKLWCVGLGHLYAKLIICADLRQKSFSFHSNVLCFTFICQADYQSGFGATSFSFHRFTVLLKRKCRSKSRKCHKPARLTIRVLLLYGHRWWYEYAGFIGWWPQWCKIEIQRISLWKPSPPFPAML